MGKHDPIVVITLDSDGDKESGEISDNSGTPKNGSEINNNSQTSQQSRHESDSDIEIIGDSLYVLDDDGAGISVNLEDDQQFEALQHAVGIKETAFDLTLNIKEVPKNTRRTCFNCGGTHTIAECNLPHDQRRISKNRNALGSSKKVRMMDRTTKYLPGQISQRVLDALNLKEDEYPLWIYRMRQQGPTRGYPVGYLKRLIPKEKTLNFFTEDPILSKSIVKGEPKFDASKIIWYNGFNSIDRSCHAERACNYGKAWQYPVYTKEEYAELLRDHVEGLQDVENAGERNRKRRHEDDGAPQKIKKVHLEIPNGDSSQGNGMGSPASPKAPPVVSYVLTEDQAAPKKFLVPVVDNRRMPDRSNFSVGITPFQIDNSVQPTGILDQIEKLIKSVRNK